MKSPFYQIHFLLIFVFGLFLLPYNIYGQENNAESKDEVERETTVKREIQYEGTEGYESPQFFKRKEKEPRPAWVEALHEARLRGDEKLMRELEAQNTTPLEKVGENVGEYVTESSGTVGFPGEPVIEGNPLASFEDWGTDIHVRSSNTDFRESHPAMATSSDGTIYVVWENFGSTQPYAYLQIYYSTDGGANWDAYGYISNPSYDLSQPTLAIGEGFENYLILAWVVDDSTPHIEVGYTPLINIGYSLTQITPPYITSWDSYQKPVIWTDSYDWDAWYPYLTCEGTYNASTNDVNVCFWRSIDYCTTFEYATTGGPGVIGQGNTYSWLDADGTYGTVGNDLFLVCFNATDNYLYAMQSTDYGATFTPGSEFQIHLVDPLPYHAVDPDIEAAVNYDNIMLCCTKSFNSADNIAQCYSTDAGVTWSSFFSLDGYTAVNEFAPELTANEGGDAWHVCYTSQDWWVYSNTRPQDLSAYWQLTPDVVNDVDWASAGYTKKAITSNWTTNLPGIAWSDYRDVVGGDYDIYFDNNATFPLSVSVLNEWNMLSIPGLHPTNQNVTTWWPNLTGSVFKFDAGYVPVASVIPSEGYWENNIVAQTYSYPAIEIVSHDPISCVQGWSMIGPYENIAPVSGLIPSVGTISSVFEFGASGYLPATNLVPGYGYWINVTDACTVTIPDPPLSKGSSEVVEYIKEDWGKITITDNAGRSYTLYSVKGEVNLNKYELPPMPPVGMFDIRYGSGRLAEDISSSIQSIDMTGIEYPLRVKVENMSITLKDETGKEINAELEPGEEITITNNSINKLLINSGDVVAPIEYTLEQNYPNPFNPSTTIKFAVPKESNVNLSIYNVLGELVSTLVNEQKKPGYYEYNFNASKLASGVYLYRIKTGDFIETKKMVLMK